MSQEKNFLDDSGLSTLITQTQARFAMLRKGLPGGVAELNSSGKIPIAQESADATLSTSSTNPVQNGAVTTEINNVKQALSNEVATRAALGAHNLLDIDIKQVKSINNIGSWSGDTYNDTTNGITWTISHTNGRISKITANGTLTGSNSILQFQKADSSHKQDFGNTNLTTQQESWASANGYTLSSSDAYDTKKYMAYNGTNKGLYLIVEESVSNYEFYPMVKRTSDSNNDYQPYAMTNRELTENKAEKSDLASISITGTTNSTGATISAGTFFYLNGSLVRAKTDIAANASFTLNTNYVTVSAGGLNDARVKVANLTLTSNAGSAIILAKSSYPHIIGANVSNPTNISLNITSGSNTQWSLFAYNEYSGAKSANTEITFDLLYLSY